MSDGTDGVLAWASTFSTGVMLGAWAPALMPYAVGVIIVRGLLSLGRSIDSFNAHEGMRPPPPRPALPPPHQEGVAGAVELLPFGQPVFEYGPRREVFRPYGGGWGYRRF